MGGKRLRPALLLLSGKATGALVDEHLTIEGEVRLKTYSDRIRQLIVSGSLDPADEKTLGKLKEKYGITDEESRDEDEAGKGKGP